MQIANASGCNKNQCFNTVLLERKLCTIAARSNMLSTRIKRFPDFFGVIQYQFRLQHHSADFFGIIQHQIGPDFAVWYWTKQISLLVAVLDVCSLANSLRFKFKWNTIAEAMHIGRLIDDFAAGFGCQLVGKFCALNKWDYIIWILKEKYMI